MALNYTLKRAKVMDGAEEVGSVRGLSLNDIIQLLMLNREAAGVLFDQLNGRDPEEIKQEDVMAVGGNLIESAPGFVAQIIALATDAHEEWDEDGDSPVETIMSMPAGLQIAFLEKIGEATFTGTTPKKLLALAMKNMPARSQGELPLGQ